TSTQPPPLPAFPTRRSSDLGGKMRSHEVTIAGYLVVLAGIVVLQVLATRTRAPVPSLGDLLTRAMRSRTGRVGVLVAWAWIGLRSEERRVGKEGSAGGAARD